jgi:hypothetical protein
VRTVLWLLISWAIGLALYGGALVAFRGEVLSLDNWTIVGSVTLVTWLVSSMLVILPILRRLISRRFPDKNKRWLALMGAGLAIVPLWLNIGFWYGWHPRHLLLGEAGFLGVHYATSGLVLSLSLPRHGVARSKD